MKIVKFQGSVIGFRIGKRWFLFDELTARAIKRSKAWGPRL